MREKVCVIVGHDVKKIRVSLSCSFTIFQKVEQCRGSPKRVRELHIVQNYESQFMINTI